MVAELIISQLPIIVAVSLMLLAAYAGIIAWFLLANRPVTNRNTDETIHYIHVLMEHNYITAYQFEPHYSVY